MGTQTIRYGPYEIVCTAMPHKGGFAASAVVVLEHGSAREETPVDFESPVFRTEEQALAHAADSGREWVDNFG